MALAMNKVVLNASTYTSLNPSNAAAGIVSLYAEIPKGAAILLASSATSTPPTNDNGSIMLGSQLDGFAFEGTIASYFGGTTDQYLNAKMEAGATYSAKAIIGCE